MWEYKDADAELKSVATMLYMYNADGYEKDGGVCEDKDESTNK